MITLSGPPNGTRKRKTINSPSKNLNKQIVPQPCPVETVFGIELLLETILENLSAKDLKQSRRVNKQWNYRATKILLRKQLLKVTPTFQDNPTKEDRQKFVSLTKTMRQSPLFPSCSFTFSHSNLSNPNLQKLVSSFGHLIQTLVISLEDKNENIPGITGQSLIQSFKHLFNRLPNMAKLTLSSKIPLLWETEVIQDFEPASFLEGSSYSNLLPKLKYLHVDADLRRNVFEFLIRAGTCIEEIYLRKCRHEILLRVLKRTKKTHLLMTTAIDFRENNSDLIAYFGNSQLNIRQLYIFLSHIAKPPPDYWPQAIQALSGVLHACAHSLTLLQIPPSFFYPHFEVPIMPQLEILSINFPDICHQIFPTNSKTFKISRVFPRLSRIYVKSPSRNATNNNTNTWSKEMYEKDFMGADYEDTVRSVKSIQFRREPELVGIQKFPLLFTNLKWLTIWDVYNVPQVLDVAWNLPALELLYFGVSIQTLENLQGECENTSSFHTLDAALTGLSEETCAKFEFNLENWNTEDLKKFKTKTSMLDAKRLKYLLIRIDDDSTEEKISPIKTILSKIAKQYAFDVCTNVKVRINLSARVIQNVKCLRDGILQVLSSKMTIKGDKNSNKCYVDL